MMGAENSAGCHVYFGAPLPRVQYIRSIGACHGLFSRLFSRSAKLEWTTAPSGIAHPWQMATLPKLVLEWRQQNNGTSVETSNRLREKPAWPCKSKSGTTSFASRLIWKSPPRFRPQVSSAVPVVPQMARHNAVGLVASIHPPPRLRRDRPPQGGT